MLITTVCYSNCYLLKVRKIAGRYIVTKLYCILYNVYVKVIICREIAGDRFSLNKLFVFFLRSFVCRLFEQKNSPLSRSKILWELRIYFHNLCASLYSESE